MSLSVKGEGGGLSRALTAGVLHDVVENPTLVRREFLTVEPDFSHFGFEVGLRSWASANLCKARWLRHSNRVVAPPQ